MTTITFFSEDVSFGANGTRLIGFEVKGHSGYAEEGEDIVCAAITNSVRLIETTLNDILGLEISIKVRESDTSIKLKLPNGLNDKNEHTAQALLAGFMLNLIELAEEYPENISIMEV